MDPPHHGDGAGGRAARVVNIGNTYPGASRRRRTTQQTAPVNGPSSVSALRASLLSTKPG
jgi:hypothetical protein